MLRESLPITMVAYWGLRGDPFGEVVQRFVPTPGHREALARLCHWIESGTRGAVIVGPSGVGKTMVLREALRRSRGPSRRVALVSHPFDLVALLSSLSEALGGRAGGTVAEAWRALGDVVRLCRHQRQSVVLAIDHDHEADEEDRFDVERLMHIDSHTEARITVVRCRRLSRVACGVEDGWELPIRLAPLTRSECVDYMAAKLAESGGTLSIFTPAAITRLHGLARGVPRAVDRLASLALSAGSDQGLRAVTPDVIDGVARECLGDADWTRRVPA